ncbi:hypothetical protein PCE1_001537 [Barthelona sp. PCE]
MNRLPQYFQQLLDGEYEERVKAAEKLLVLSKNQHNRIELAHYQGFIESVCIPLLEDDVQELQITILSILQCLLLEDPTIDTFIVNEESLLPGLAKILYETDSSELKLLILEVLDICAILPNNQTLVASEDGLVCRISQLLNEPEYTKWCISCLSALASHPHNLFVLPRVKYCLESLLQFLNENEMGPMHLNVLDIIRSFADLEENHSILIREPNLVETLSAFSNGDYETINVLCESILEKLANSTVEIDEYAPSEGVVNSSHIAVTDSIVAEDFDFEIEADDIDKALEDELAALEVPDFVEEEKEIEEEEEKIEEPIEVTEKPVEIVEEIVEEVAEQE